MTKVTTQQDYVLALCEVCNQMTNHDQDGNCLKHGTTQGEDDE